MQPVFFEASTMFPLTTSKRMNATKWEKRFPTRKLRLSDITWCSKRLAGSESCEFTTNLFKDEQHSYLRRIVLSGYSRNRLSNFVRSSPEPQLPYQPRSVVRCAVTLRLFLSPDMIRLLSFGPLKWGNDKLSMKPPDVSDNHQSPNMWEAHVQMSWYHSVYDLYVDSNYSNTKRGQRWHF